MRKALDRLYQGTAVLAAIMLVVLASMIILQIAARFVDVAIVWAGDVAGYSLVATSFLALAPTFRNGVHVRVNLLLKTASEGKRRALELFCVLVCLALSGYFAYACINLAYESYLFDERSTGLVPFELWMPQSIMAFGVTVFFIAHLDALMALLRGEVPAYDAASPALAGELGPVEPERQQYRVSGAAAAGAGYRAQKSD